MLLTVWINLLIVQVINVKGSMLISSCGEQMSTMTNETKASATAGQKEYDPGAHMITGTKVNDTEKETEEHDNRKQGTTNDNNVYKKPCSIVVLSNVQNPNMQSLMRKYRYNAKGILIPGSVRYFFKLPQGLHSTPLLVPINDKAFSPLGGFVRYYKEVPPIPQSW